MGAYFITGTGTDIGKTHIVSLLIKQAQMRHKQIHAVKPVISGFDQNNPQKSDTGIILTSLGRKINKTEINQLSPFRYQKPLSPDHASLYENSEIIFEHLVAFCKHQLLEHKDKNLLIEGVGGVMVPLNQNKTTLDWIKACNIPAILVCGSYLGALSHSLTAYHTLKQYEIPIRMMIINESRSQNVGLDQTRNSLSNFILDIPIICTSYCAYKTNNLKEDIFTYYPDMTDYFN